MSALRKAILVLSAAVVLAAWGIAARFYAVDGAGAYSGPFAIFIFAAGGLTIGAAWLIWRAWREGPRPLVATLAATFVSALAVLSILWLAAAINLRG